MVVVNETAKSYPRSAVFTRGYIFTGRHYMLAARYSSFDVFQTMHRGSCTLSDLPVQERTLIIAVAAVNPVGSAQLERNRLFLGGG